MKLKAPEGVGDPCVAGAVIAPRNGLYEVEAEIGALLIECFGFVEIEERGNATASGTFGAPSAPRRRPSAKKPPAEV